MEHKTALLLIDIQKGLDDWDFYGGNRNNLDAEQNAAKILGIFRSQKRPIFHVQHGSTNPESPLYPSKTGFHIKDEVRPLPNETVFIKDVNSAFIGTDLEQTLRNKQIDTLVVAGLTTNHCISTSVRMGANLGFKIILIADACATFDQMGLDGKKQPAELVHQVSLASLKDEFASVITTTEVLARSEIEK